MTGEVGITRRGQDGVVTEDLLDFQQIDAVFDQVRGVAVAQAVRGDLFLALFALSVGDLYLKGKLFS